MVSIRLFNVALIVNKPSQVFDISVTLVPAYFCHSGTQSWEGK